MPDTDDDLNLEAPSPEDAGALMRLPADPYAGVSMLVFNQKQQEILTRPLSLDQVDVKPTGEVYVSHVHVRRVLNDAVGPGKWGLRPLGPLTMREKILFREYGLYINGQFVASAIGSQEYFADNDKQNFADAAEATKSNCLSRCSKDLLIFSELWDKRWTDQYRKTYCTQVKVKENRRSGQTIVDRWRRKDADPLPGEMVSGEARTESVIDVAIHRETTHEEPPSAAEIFDKPGLTKISFPSDVFAAGNLRGWPTKQLNDFVKAKFGKAASQLEKGDECARAVKAVQAAD